MFVVFFCGLLLMSVYIVFIAHQLSLISQQLFRILRETLHYINVMCIASNKACLSTGHLMFYANIWSGASLMLPFSNDGHMTVRM